MNFCKRNIITSLIFLLPCFVSISAGADNVCDELAGLNIIGELEYVTIPPSELRLKARIDTGAQTSSISAIDITRFERDGKKWVSFSVIVPGTTPGAEKKIELKRPLISKVNIKRHDAESQERKVVELPITIGGKTFNNKFSLTDRTKFKYPVLIGRDLLLNRFIVDVNRKYILHEKEEEE